MIASVVVSNLIYLIGALGLAVMISLVVVLRHRKPKSVEANMATFHRGLRALAPDQEQGRRRPQPPSPRVPAQSARAQSARAPATSRAPLPRTPSSRAPSSRTAPPPPPRPITSGSHRPETSSGPTREADTG